MYSRTAVATALAICLVSWQRLPEAQSRRVPVGIPSEAIARARAHGFVRVIAKVDVPYSTGATAGDARGPQRAALAAAQESVVGRLSRGHRARRFAYAPYIAVEADEADLRALAASGAVSEIRIDRLSAPVLAESLSLIGAVTAAAGDYRGTGWTIAVLDTGVDKTHPSLVPDVVSEACYSSTVPGLSQSVCPGGAESSVAPDSAMPCGLGGCGHGTHVAGIVTGVARNATVIAIQVFSAITSECDGEPAPCVRSFDSDVIAGLERVYELRNTHSIAAVNLSLGRDLFPGTCDGEPIKPLIDQLRAAGIATVVASGNDGSPAGLSAPACVSSAISVGSSTDGSSGVPADRVSSFSNSSPQLTLIAPGERITAPAPGGGSASLSGTSMAAPHVAGAWALMREINRAATVTEVTHALSSTGVGIFDARNGLTRPRIQIMAALSAMPPRCTFTVVPDRVSLPRGGGTINVTVQASASDCNWYVSNQLWWASSTTQNNHIQTGSRTVAVTVGVNHDSPRTGVIVVAGVAITIDQHGGKPGDINGDGLADLIWQHATTGSIAAWYVNGYNVTGAAPFSTDRVADLGWRIAGAGDINGDGPTDLVWQHDVSGRLAVWYLSGVQVISTAPLSIDRVTDTDWKIRAVGDTNGDGFADLIWQHRTNGGLAVWLMRAAQVVQTQYLSIDRMTDSNWHVVAAGDVDRDGRADLFWQHQTSGMLGLWLLDGARVVFTTRLSVESVPDTAWKLRGAGDANGDGRADLFWQHESSGAVGVWYMSGRFVLEQWRLSGSVVADPGWTIVGPG